MNGEEYGIDYRIPFCILVGCKIYQMKYDDKNDLIREEKEILGQFAEQNDFNDKFKSIKQSFSVFSYSTY